MAHDYPCGSCGGIVEAVMRPGRTTLYRGVQCIIPDDLPIRTCRQCGAEWMHHGEIHVISEILERQRKAHQDALQNANEAPGPPVGCDPQSQVVGTSDALPRPPGVAERAMVPDSSTAEGADLGDDETAVLGRPDVSCGSRA